MRTLHNRRSEKKNHGIRIPRIDAALPRVKSLEPDIYGYRFIYVYFVNKIASGEILPEGEGGYQKSSVKILHGMCIERPYMDAICTRTLY